MRIRKRQVPLPLSSLLPVHLPDPMVQLNPPPIPSDDDDTAAYFNGPSSPHPQIQPIQLTTAQTANSLLRDESSNASRSAKTDTSANHEQQQQEFQMKRRVGDSKKKKSVEESGKKRGRGGTIMEGSRCSRVNGRGWRCCQQTLVGYSLCEHHLGKGRLRSMNSVRRRSKGHDSESEDPTFEGKKSSKLGIVKARSMSSLLGQDSDN